MPITALARQREREQKRRQKLRRSQERQRKGKGKSKKNGQNLEVARSVLLTEEDRNMLERWNKMQGKNKDQESSVDAPQINKDPSLHSTEPEKDTQNKTLHTHKRVSSDAPASAIGVFPNTQPPSHSSVHDEPLCPITNAVSQLRKKQDTAQCATAIDKKILGGGVMDTSSALSQQQSTQVVSGYGNMFPSASFSLPTSSQGQRHQQTSYGGINIATSVSGSETLGMSGAPSFFNSQSLAQDLFTRSEGNNSNNVAIVNTQDHPQPSVVDTSASKAPVSTVNNNSTAHYHSGCPPVVSSSSAQASKMDSSFQQYRSRHYSDRETPSPPHNVQQSPPAYEDAMKAKYTTSYTSPTGWSLSILKPLYTLSNLEKHK